MCIIKLKKIKLHPYHLLLLLSRIRYLLFEPLVCRIYTAIKVNLLFAISKLLNYYYKLCVSRITMNCDGTLFKDRRELCSRQDDWHASTPTGSRARRICTLVCFVRVLRTYSGRAEKNVITHSSLWHLPNGWNKARKYTSFDHLDDMRILKNGFEYVAHAILFFESTIFISRNRYLSSFKIFSSLEISYARTAAVSRFKKLW